MVSTNLLGMPGGHVAAWKLTVFVFVSFFPLINPIFKGKRNLQTSVSKKMTTEVTDSPYQVSCPLKAMKIMIASGCVNISFEWINSCNSL